MLPIQYALIDGLLLSLILGAIVMGSLRYNARLWLQDYPKPIRDKVPPLSPIEKRERLVVAVLTIGVLFGGVFLETMRLRAGHVGEMSFGGAYRHLFLMLLMFNLFDAIVLDLIILTWFTPRFAILPGTEGMEYLFRDYRKHLTDFLKGLVFCVVASLPFAIMAIL